MLSLTDRLSPPHTRHSEQSPLSCTARTHQSPVASCSTTLRRRHPLTKMYSGGRPAMSRHDARALVGIARAGRAAGAAPQLRERKLARAPAEEIGRAWSGTAAGAGVGAAGPTCARVAGGAARTGSDGDARNQRVGWGHRKAASSGRTRGAYKVDSFPNAKQWIVRAENTSESLRINTL